MLLYSCSNTSIKSNSEQQNKIAISENWDLFPNSSIQDPGEIISKPGFKPKKAIKTSIPKTVLQSQIEQGIYTDVYLGDHITKIPVEEYQQAWWYRNEFSLENTDQNYELQFDGINYKANIWFNGVLIADSSSANNAFKQYKFDVSSYVIQGQNVIAIQVYSTQPGDFSIGFVDWNPSAPDQNMGLFRPVYLNTIDKVQILEPYVESIFENGDYTISKEIISLKLKNYQSKTIQGELQIEFLGRKITQSVEIAAGNNQKFVFHPNDYQELIIENPQLWWPHTYGEPVLNDLNIDFSIDDLVVASQQMKFGIREVQDFFNKNGHRGFMINGEKISIRGGGWVDNLMLNNTHAYDEAQLQYVKDMNLNTIRLEGFWGKDEHLYQRCDELGILIMVGWSCHWEWEDYLGKFCDEKYGGILNDYDITMMAEAWKDQILWLRNHPSIMTWFSGSDCVPAPKLEALYFETFKEYDTSRVYLASAKEWESGDIETGVKMRGPYAYVPPVYWFADTLYGGAFGFNTETGPGAQVPPLESIKKMIPQKDLWPINEMWNFHCGRKEFNTLDRFTKALNERYGEAHSVEEYAQKAQLLNYELMRPMFEAFSVNRYDATGVIQWMLNSAWPEMYWQLYDSYLLPNAAYFATKKAGMPLQAIYNYDDEGIYIVNDQLQDEENIIVDMKVFDINSKLIKEESKKLSSLKNSSIKVLSLKDIEKLSSTYFLDLRVSKGEREVASNFYWLSTKEDVLDYEATVPNWYYHTPSKEYANLQLLNTMPKTNISFDMTEEVLEKETIYSITLQNKSSNIAFFLEMFLKDQASNNTILPVLWEDNYLSLLPNEKRTIKARVMNEYLQNQKAVLSMDAFNSEK